MEEVKKLVTSAARDCVAQERNSFVAFQAKTGVEVYLLFFCVCAVILVDMNF